MNRLDLNNLDAWKRDKFKRLVKEMYTLHADRVYDNIMAGASGHHVFTDNIDLIVELGRLFKEDGFTIELTLALRDTSTDMFSSADDLFISWPTITYGPETEKYKELYNKFNE